MTRIRFEKGLKLRHLVAAAALFALVAPAAALAGAFAISEAGSKASGRAGAVSALHDDPSTVFYNPANVSRAEGLRIALGASGLMPRWEYRPPGGGVAERSEAGIITPPNFSATWQLGNSGFGDLGLGLGAYVPYGSTFAWPEGWSGREAIQKIALQVFEISPVLALRPHRGFAFGLGFRYLPSAVYLKQAVRFGDAQEGTVELAGKGSGTGLSAGISLWPVERLAFALTWRSPVTLQMDGVSDFDLPPAFAASARDRDVRTEVPLAEVIRVGAAWHVIPQRLNVSADVEYQLWSTYEALSVTFIDRDGTEETTSSPRNSENSLVVRVGGEVALSRNVALRAGYAFDQRTLPEETVNPAPPDSDRHVATLGASFTTRRFGAHVHFSNVFFSPRTSLNSDFPGQWEGALPAATMAYTFGLTLSANVDVFAPLGHRGSL